MMKIQKKSAIPADKNDRRRGRPAGKNRTPLSLEERRARNAQYERERRNETADAMAQLAEAACCDPQISNAELLATVISQLQRRGNRKLPQDIEKLKRVNQNLESQIAALQTRLGFDVDINTEDEDSNDNSSEELNESSEHDSTTEEILEPNENEKLYSVTTRTLSKTTKEIRRPKKIRKTSKSSSVHKTDTTESDTESDSSSSYSNWSESEVSQSQKLRKRSQTVSEQSQDTASTYLYKTESESSQHETRSLKHSADSNQSDDLDDSMNINVSSLSAIPEIKEVPEDYGADDQTENPLFESFTDSEKSIINEWIDFSAGLVEGTDHPDDHRVKTFLEFDDFLLDIDA